tara:strand:+ start:52 stop:684 length:633 start_codon:yes stop_codon:yes gene_type:complete
MSNGIGGLGGGLLNYARNLQGSGETNEEKRARLLEIVSNMGTPAEIEEELSQHTFNVDKIRERARQKYEDAGLLFINPGEMGPFSSEEGYLPYNRETMDIQQTLDSIKASMQPKAHNDIDKLISSNDHKNMLMDLITGGGVGGTIKTGLNLGKSGSKIIDELRILEKIRGRNKSGLEKLGKMPGTGEASIPSSVRAFFRNEEEKFKNLFK